MYWPESEVETAMQICRLESNGVANADNWKDSHVGCNGSFGLFQIGCLHGVTRDQLHIPELNIKVAYNLWSTQGWYPWSTYKLLALK